MQFVNDDMDELYRRAAENYPLRTDGADWDKVLGQLHEAAPAVAPKKQSNARFLWLLLLVPMFFICNRYSGKSIVTTSDPSIATHQTRNAQPNQHPQQLHYPEKRSFIANEQINDDKGERVLSKDESFITGDPGEHDVSRKRYTVNSFLPTTEHNITPIGKRVQQAGEKSEPFVKGDDIRADQQIAVQNDREIVAKNATKVEVEKLTEDLAEILGQVADSNNVVQQQAGEKRKASRSRRLYYGIVAGPDFSTVKLQKISGVGYNAGLLLGYRISSRLSVETGLIWENKQYYSSGEYFDMGKMNWPPNTKLVYIDGVCNMVEVPLNMRYDWLQKSDHQFFAAAGLSSYLMNKESYEYLVKRYNNPYYGEKDYRHASKDWFSVVHLSAGYQKKLGKAGQLRIEPYFKLPVNGIGIGNMSISSAGIYFGFTRFAP